ncbi:hypothetical protein KAS06_00590 [Candidatus Bathyarchaeota archaeon]|nr:hypothetical protein [Candidatus Bathyarchaeota archaeon]
MNQDRRQDVWAPFRFFVGSWKGTSEGCSGTSITERNYEFVLDGKFLQARNRSIFKPQKKNLKGEIHEDIGFFSYDDNRKKFVLRQFHVEGFVNQYVLESIVDDGRIIVFVTESIENIPLGWRAKETYNVLNNDEFTEIFELAAPGKNFEVYTKNHLRRKK